LETDNDILHTLYGWHRLVWFLEQTIYAEAQMSHNTEMNWHWIKCYESAVGLHIEFTATYVSFLTVREKFSNNKAKGHEKI